MATEMSPGRKIAQAFNTGEIDWPTALKQLLKVDFGHQEAEAPYAPSNIGQWWLDVEDEDSCGPGTLCEVLAVLPSEQSLELGAAVWDQDRAAEGAPADAATT